MISYPVHQASSRRVVLFLLTCGGSGSESTRWIFLNTVTVSTLWSCLFLTSTVISGHRRLAGGPVRSRP